MNVSYTHESIRLTGRWDTSDPHVAVATATGSYIEFAFEGKMALARFDVLTNATPRLHLWISIDGGDMIEAPIDAYLRVNAKEDGKHICRIIYKGGTEQDRRWFAPLTGKVSFVGVQTEKPLPIPADTRKTIEFVGDSITEGVLIDVDYFAEPGEAYPLDQHNRRFQDDVCATYAWQTAEALSLRPIFMGYGGVGVTKGGGGAVPTVSVSYPYNFDGSPITREEPDYIMINHGTNDKNQPAEIFLEKYAELLNLIRAKNPNATVISLSPFCGAFHEELGSMIAEYNEKNGCCVHFIDTFGWIPEKPIHPLRSGHTGVAKNLIPLLGNIIKD